MDFMNSRQRSACHGIIHTASAAAASVGGSMAQIPGGDNAVIVPIQLSMIIALGRVFGFALTEGAARAGMATMTATTIGRTASQLLVGWIPGPGNVINACTAASVTEAMGWMMARDFARQAAFASPCPDSAF